MSEEKGFDWVSSFCKIILLISAIGYSIFIFAESIISKIKFPFKKEGLNINVVMSNSSLFRYNIKIQTPIKITKKIEEQPMLYTKLSDVEEDTKEEMVIKTKDICL